MLSGPWFRALHGVRKRLVKDIPGNSPSGGSFPSAEDWPSGSDLRSFPGSKPALSEPVTEKKTFPGLKPALFEPAKKKAPAIVQMPFSLVRLSRFELLTSCLSSKRSEPTELKPRIGLQRYTKNLNPQLQPAIIRHYLHREGRSACTVSCACSTFPWHTAACR